MNRGRQGFVYACRTQLSSIRNRSSKARNSLSQGSTARWRRRPITARSATAAAVVCRNRKALVTGGDSGIGRAAAIAFAREGADVAINYLPSEESDAKEVIALIEAEGRKAFAFPGDIGNEKFARKLVKDAYKKLGGLDVLACVAGKQHAVEKIAEVTTKQMEETYRVNVFALFWMCQEALAVMPKGGTIITTASIQATHPQP